MNRPQVIFFGNGPLADYTLAILEQSCDILFHARTSADLETVKALKAANPTAFGVLASFGVLIKSDLLDLFEPEGILNLHPSLLPSYRGASPIESAILAGDSDFSFSIMKLARKMDAGPIYFQDTLSNLPLDKHKIYQSLAEAGASWLTEHLTTIRTLTPAPQDEAKSSYTCKLDKSMSFLRPESHSAEQILRQIVAYQDFPKPKYTFFGKTCIILSAHLDSEGTSSTSENTQSSSTNSRLFIECQDGNKVIIDSLQPEGKKPMDTKSFLNGYGKTN